MELTIPFNYQPRTYQLPILQARDEGYKRFILCWHRRCLASGTKISMWDGSFKAIENIEPGDKVVSFNGEELVPGVVTKRWDNGVATVTSRNNLWITDNHKVYNHDKKCYLRADETKSFTRAGVLPFGDLHNPELAEFLGLMLTDGSVTWNQTPKFTNTDSDLLNRFKELVGALFPEVAIKEYAKGKGYDLVCTLKEKTGRGKHLFREYFNDSNKMPDIVWEFDRESSLAFLAGVIAGDGSLNYKKTISPHGYPALCGSMTIEAGISQELANDYVLFLKKFGFYIKIKKDPRGRNYRVLNYSLQDLHAISDMQIHHKEKQRRLQEIIANTKATGRFRLKAVEIGDTKECETYDLTVEGTHAYIAEGFIVHNSGKDKTAINFLMKEMWLTKGLYYYFFPTYNQGRKVLWEGIDAKTGFKIMDHIPKELRTRTNESELLIELKNGSIFRIIGTDNVDSVVGTNPVGCVFSEYSLQDPKAWDFIRPILTENGGWAMFIFTPRGENHAFDLLQMAEESEDWYTSKLTVKDTGIISMEDIQREIAEGMDKDLVQQEYFVSFTGAMQGSYYGDQLKEAENRITSVPYETALPVHTFWDIGVGDSTAIWFMQQVGNELRFIDCYENNGEGLNHYANVLNEKGYTYGNHYGPHDLEVRELGTGRSRKEVALSLGINFRIAPKLSIDDGINAVRMVFNKCWFDKEKCKDGLRALKHYRKDYDEKKHTFKSAPLHDWSSHFADAFRYFAVSYRDKPVEEAPNRIVNLDPYA